MLLSVQKQKIFYGCSNGVAAFVYFYRARSTLSLQQKKLFWWDTLKREIASKGMQILTLRGGLTH